MKDEILKGNFKVKKSVNIADDLKKDNFDEEYKKKAISSVGGSMVYMERTELTWDGDNN